MNIIGIDPGNGKRGTLGVALFGGHVSEYPASGELKATSTFRARAPADPWCDLASQVLRWCASQSAFTAVDKLVIEVPQVYGGGRTGTAQANDLIGILGVGAFVAGFLQPAQVVTYHPREWKGSIDGDDFIRERIKPALSDAERRRVEMGTEAAMTSPRGGPTSHEWDAAGIVLFYLGRLKPRKVFPR